MLTAPSSNSGKTMLTCGLLQLLKDKGLRIASFKCGPDFIDPMFHTKVIGTKSRNLDSFFTDPDTLRSLLARNAEGCSMAVLEGVMGYFDGLSPENTRASASDVAEITGTPVILIVNAGSASRSVLPLIKGFLDFEKEKNIKGVILNRISPVMYPVLKPLIEGELGITVAGYVPVLKDCILESRHLGLMMPDEIDDLHDKLKKLSRELEKSLEIDRILEIASSAADLPDPAPPAKKKFSGLRIGLAKDEAFCFFYEDNLQMLRDLGAELVPFSPVHDRHLPEGLDGLLFHGGYPELYAKQLSENISMLAEVRAAVNAGLPTMAECGGFLYLHETLQDMEGNILPMAGVVRGSAHYTGKLTRFGYIILKEGRVFGRDTGDIRSHEFHYFDSESCGEDFLAVKPSGKRSWRCIHSTDSLFAGFPHMYYNANPQVPEAFLAACAERKHHQS